MSEPEMKTHDMTTNEATEWVYAQDESGEIDAQELEAAFAALYKRPATDDDRQAGLWSLCCAATPNCGTRPDEWDKEIEADVKRLGEDEFVRRLEKPLPSDWPHVTDRSY